MVSRKQGTLAITAQKAAKRLGLDNDQRALVDAAQQRTVTAQIKSLERHAEIVTQRKNRKAAAPKAKVTYPTAFQNFKMWFDMQHVTTRKQIIAWLQTLNTADLIAELSKDVLEGNDPLGDNIH